MARTRTLTLTPRNAAALVSPVRQEILSALGLHGPCSVRDLAKNLGRRATALYYHLQILERAGAVASESTAEAERSQVVWRVTIDRVANARKARAPHEPAERAMAKAALRLAGRELDRALAQRGTSPPRVVALRGKAWLGEAELRKVMGHIEAIAAVLQRARPARRGAQIHAVTLIVAPILDNGDATP